MQSDSLLSRTIGGWHFMGSKLTVRLSGSSQYNIKPLSFLHSQRYCRYAVPDIWRAILCLIGSCKIVMQLSILRNTDTRAHFQPLKPDPYESHATNSSRYWILNSNVTENTGMLSMHQWGSAACALSRIVYKSKSPTASRVSVPSHDCHVFQIYHQLTHHLSG